MNVRLSAISQRGFSLLEVLIVITILAILVGIALPAYQDSTQKTRRSEGHSLLLEGAHIMERHFTEFGRYGTTVTNTGESDGDTVVVTGESENGYYTILLSASNVDASSFLLTAQPQGGQADDPCGNLTIDHTGIKGITGTGVDITQCW